LALQSEIDSRPLYVERALLVFECDDGGWWLVTAARTPRECIAWRQRWGVAAALDAWYGAERFSKRPTKEDVTTFLRVTDWRAEPESGWHRLRSEKYVSNWRAALGFDPIEEFFRVPPKKRGIDF